MFQNNLLMGAASISAGGFSIDNGCRFNSGDSTLFTQTLGSAPTDASKGILSGWFKRSDIGILNEFWCAPNEDFHLGITTEDAMSCNDHAYSTYVTTQTYTDPSAWFHVVCSYDSDQSDAAERIQLYYNGTRITSFSYSAPTNTSLGEAWGMSANGVVVRIGNAYNGGGIWGGYMAQNLMVDGLSIQNEDYALTDFGELDDNGVWRPVDVTELTFGNNGWLVDFADSSNLGNDVSGNDNDFASSGFDADDQVVDTPTTNYVTYSSIVPHGGTISNGGLKLAGVSYDGARAGSSLIDYGYWEVEGLGSSVEGGYRRLTGICTAAHNVDTNPGTSGSANANRIGVDIDNDFYDLDESGGPSATYSGTWLTGDELCFAVRQNGADVDIWIRENSDAFFEGGDPAAGSTPTFTWDDVNVEDLFAFSTCYNSSDIVETNFGQKGFAHTPPAGFKAINTANISTPTIPDGTAHFQTTLYTGNGSSRNIDQTGNSTFQTDFVWIKNRDTTDNHMLIDIARGVTKQIHSNSSGVETTDTNGLTSFDSDGFGLGSGAGGYNDNTEDFVAWQWLAGGGAGSSNEDGTINTTTTTVNTTAGISIGTYTGTGSAATIGHGLGVAPSLIIVKCRNDGVGAGQGHFYVYHKANTSAPETDYLLLNTTAGTVDSDAIWNDTAPTSTVFSIGTGVGVNESSNTYIYYAFAEIEGFSNFGTYIGNGTGSGGGPFSYTGFTPAFIICKATTRTSDWYMSALAMNVFNSNVTANRQVQYANLAYGDADGYGLQIFSNGFKQYDGAENNSSGNTYIYMAFAQYPFGGASTTPATAR
jgi:hypothetical protein